MENVIEMIPQLPNQQQAIIWNNDAISYIIFPKWHFNTKMFLRHQGIGFNAA